MHSGYPLRRPAPPHCDTSHHRRASARWHISANSTQAAAITSAMGVGRREQAGDTASSAGAGATGAAPCGRVRVVRCCYRRLCGPWVPHFATCAEEARNRRTVLQTVAGFTSRSLQPRWPGKGGRHLDGGWLRLHPQSLWRQSLLSLQISASTPRATNRSPLSTIA